MRRRDFPKFPRFLGAWNGGDVNALDRFMQALKDYLQRPDYRIVEFTFTGSSSAPTKTIDASVSPAGVLVLALYRVDSAGDVSIAQTTPFQWTFADGTLTFPSLAGMTAGTTYRLRVLLWEGV